MAASSGITVVDAARQLGVARRTVYNWLDKGAPRFDDGTVDPEMLREWARVEKEARRAEQLEQSADDVERQVLKSQDGAESRKWGIEYRKAKALLALMEVKRLRNELIEMAEHKRILVARARMFRNNALAVPQRMMHQCANKTPIEVHQILDEEMRRMLNAMADGHDEPAPSGEVDDES